MSRILLFVGVFTMFVACETTPVDTVEITNEVTQTAWTGVVTYAFEEYSFRVCGQTEKWWVIPGISGLYGGPCYRETEGGFHSVCVHWAHLEGELSPEGHYGHLNHYPHVLKVTNVLEFRELLQGECP